MKEWPATRKADGDGMRTKGSAEVHKDWVTVALRPQYHGYYR